MALAPDGYIPTTRERLSLFSRLFRGSQPADPYTLVASGLNVDLGNESAIQATLRNRQQWQSQVWDALDACGEVSNGVMTLGSLLSRIVVYVAEYPDEADGTPTRTSNEQVVNIANRLGTPMEVSQLLKQAGIQKLLPGEYQLVGIQPSSDRPNKLREEYLVLSLEDLKAEGSSAVIEHPSGASIKLRAGSDTWIRIWTPHPKKQRLAYSPLRPLLNNIDELVWWDSAASSVAMNRLALAGMIGFPSNLETPIEAGDPPGLSGTQRFIKKWLNNVVRAIREPRSPSATVPLAFTYPWNEHGKSGVEVISMDRPQDELLEKRTDRSLRRIAQGFPLPPEFFFGTGEATYGGATQISRDKFTEYVEPFVIDLIADWTRHWLQPILIKSGLDPLKYLFWYDASALITIPRWEEQANKGLEYGAVSPKAWRRVNNFSEADKAEGAPETAEEQLDWIRALRGREGNPSVQEDNEPDSEGNLTPVPTELRDGESHPPRRKPSAPARGKGQPILSSVPNPPTNNLGRRLAEIDADLLSRLQVMASEQLRSALIKGGNFLRSRANKNPSLRASLKNVPSEQTALHLGRETVLSLGTDGMLDDTFTEVPRLFSSWCDKAVGAAIEAAELPSTIVSSATFQLAYSTDDAAIQLVRDLKELAASLMFEQSSSESSEPESNDSLVPVSIIRRALAKVGNPSPNGHTNLLLATGRSFAHHLAEAGHYATSHEWVYPVSPRRHNQAHRRLDGQKFKVDDSPMQPGQGTHCFCLAAPVFEE